MAAALLAALVLLSGLRWWNFAAQGAAVDRAYRYRFERASRGSIVRELQREIAFQQERVARDPRGGLDLAALAGAYLRMARATGDLSWYLLAEQAARRSHGNLPFDNAGAILVRARIAEARHDFVEAIRLAGLVPGAEESLAVTVTSYLALGRVGLADLAADRLVRQSPSLGSHTLRALVRVARGQDEAALRDLQDGLAVEEPRETGASALARVYLGRLYYRRGQMHRAAALYREALRFMPQHPLALLNMAELELRRGRYRAAERHFSGVVTIAEASPNVFDHAVLRGLARLRDLQGHRVAAVQIWNEAERRLRRDATTGTFGHRRELARLLLERGRPEDVPEALALMRTEVRTRRDAETLDVLAGALAAAGRFADARAAMRGALRWGIRDAGMFYRAGLIERSLGDEAAAQAFFRTAQSIDPTFDARARRLLGLGR